MSQETKAQLKARFASQQRVEQADFDTMFDSVNLKEDNVAYTDLVLSGTDAANLQNNSNWDANNNYIGTVITSSAIAHNDDNYVYLNVAGNWQRIIKGAAVTNWLDDFNVGFWIDASKQATWTLSGGRTDTIVDEVGNSFPKVGTGFIANADSIERDGGSNYLNVSSFSAPGTSDFAFAIVIARDTDSWDACIEDSNAENGVYLQWNGLSANDVWNGHAFTFGSSVPNPYNGDKFAFLLRRSGTDLTCMRKIGAGAWVDANENGTHTAFDANIDWANFKGGPDGLRIYALGVFNEYVDGANLTTLQNQIESIINN